MTRHLEPVNVMKALTGHRIKEVRHGSDASQCKQPYAVYTLVLDNDDEIVITQLLGEIGFSRVKTV